ncbi:type II secretion system F family protein [Noviherbaspirillum aerium]|uniref:type II secretion system F family protein n=1 Tax=Noviherbaspirillum aerium TaxID=2588497 RepID=UPI00124D6449|nr:type II secretion system F family protein [Noviherbaspirillum aerium]
MDILHIAVAFAVFVSAALLVEGLYLWWNAFYSKGARRLARRLREDRMEAPAEVTLQKRRRLSGNARVERFLGAFKMADVLARLLEQAGSPMTVARFLLLCGGVFLAVLALLGLRGASPLASIPAGLAAGAVPLVLLLRRRTSRLATMEQQLPEALELMSRALRAGHALPTAIKIVADEMPEPLAGQFRIVHDEVTYGIPMQEALKGLSSRIPGSDVGYFVVATLIQREVGGNLTQLLDVIARIIRERLKLASQIKVYSAEGRLSAWILGLLPFALGAVLYLVNPTFMEPLWNDPAGAKMLVIVAALMGVGVLWMRSVIRIRV